MENLCESKKACFDEKLLNHIKQHNNEEVKIILGNNNSYELSDHEGSTLLHYSTKHGNASLTRYLIEKGCAVDAKNKEGYTPLALAVEISNEEIIEMLLDAHADIYSSTGKRASLLKSVIQSYLEACAEEPFDYVPQSELHKNIMHKFLNRVKEDFASDAPSMAKILLDAKCPLHRVIEFIKNAEVTRHFIVNGGEAIIKASVEECTALELAIELGDLANIEVLVEYVNVNRDFDSSETDRIELGLDNSSPMGQGFQRRSKVTGGDADLFYPYIDVIELLLLHGANIQTSFLESAIILHGDTFCDIELQGFFISHLLLLEAYGKLEDIITDLLSEYSSSEFFENYKSEIKAMKSTKVYKSMTMFELITTEDKKLIRYVANQDFISSIETAIQKTTLAESYYYKYLNKRIAKAVNIHEYKKKASSALYNISGFDQLVVDEIISYLSIKEFRSLCSV